MILKTFPFLTGFLLMTGMPAFAQQTASPAGATTPSESVAATSGVTAAQGGAQADDGEEIIQLSPRGTLNAARRLIRDQFPGLRDKIEMDVSPSGVLVVAGEVTYLSDKLAVGRALVDLPGGTAVLNAITTRPPLRSDQAIQRDVERLLRVDPELPNVRVQVIRQVVYIPEGAVPDLFITQAIQRVGRIPGVVDVLVGPLS